MPHRILTPVNRLLHTLVKLLEDKQLGDRR
jgi:hypothetical protein